MKLKIILSLFLILSISKVLFAQTKTSIAVLEMESNGVSQMESRALTDRLRVELFSLEKYTIVERDKMNEILDEQGFQMTQIYAKLIDKKKDEAIDKLPVI